MSEQAVGAVQSVPEGCQSASSRVQVPRQRGQFENGSVGSGRDVEQPGESAGDLTPATVVPAAVAAVLRISLVSRAAVVSHLGMCTLQRPPAGLKADPFPGPPAGSVVAV